MAARSYDFGLAQRTAMDLTFSGRTAGLGLLLDYYRSAAWQTDIQDRLLWSQEVPVVISRRIFGVSTAHFVRNNDDGLLAPRCDDAAASLVVHGLT